MPIFGGNLDLTGHHSTNQPGFELYSFRWNVLGGLGAIEQWFDVAIEPGFVNYHSQNQLGLSAETFDVILGKGTYWCRVNTRYDTGDGWDWHPSDVVKINVLGGSVPVEGTPAHHLTLFSGALYWALGTGPSTRLAIDFSTYRNFDDVLAAPFIPVNNARLDITRLPISADVPVNSISLALFGTPPEKFYCRVNTLFGQTTWKPSETLQFGGSPPYLLYAAGAVAVGLVIRNLIEEQDNE